jgi:hypothetical protein
VIHAPVPPEAWAAEGARVAGTFEDVAAALVVGRDPTAAFAVAFAIARAQVDGRRVAIGDLVGALPPLTSDADTAGLAECFRDGIPVSDIARPLTDDGSVFALPSGRTAVAERWVFESARWERLVSGFREVDALLLLIAAPDAPGLRALAGVVDGVVAVDLPPTLVREWPLLATVDRPEEELPPIVAPGSRTGTPAGRSSPARRWRRRMGAAAAAAVAAVALLALVVRDRGPQGSHGDAAAGLDLDTAAGAGPVAAAARPATDTITLGPVVNPADSAIAAEFSVELVAANTLASANSRLALRGERLPAPTVAPVLLGADGRPWYRALAGAWREREEARSHLATLRARGLVRQEVGRVLRVPFALRLATGVRRDDASALVRAWSDRGIPAYALLQDDGSVSVFAGAFETSGQSVLLAVSLRDLGTEPVVAFRTGRTF